MGEKVNNLKEKASEPTVNAKQLIIFIAIVIYNIVSNATIFEGMDAVWNVTITIASYFLIMILRGKLGGDTMNILKSMVEIVIGPGNEMEKISKMENMLVWISREIGIFYDKQMDALKTYLKEKKNKQLLDD